MDLADHATTITFLLRDRDSRFTTAFDAVFAADGIRILTSPPRAPRANAICQRMTGTLRRELLDRILIVNEHHLRRILAIYLQHFNTARPHRTLGQLTPAQAENQTPTSDQPGPPSDPPQTHPRRAHQRVSNCSMTTKGTQTHRSSPPSNIRAPQDVHLPSARPGRRDTALRACRYPTPQTGL
jgi:hypothetical protein